MVLPMSMAVGNCVVTTIPSNRENVALENAKGQGIPVTVVDKRGFLVRVQIRHMARWHLGFFRTSSTESMRFYPMADGTVGWEDKRQLDLFSEGAGT